ncbi:MAG: tRNA 2-thiouridine(34) synthase MnmA [Mogibacterium sp.]|nr:tRNA 2-thiouridine(34) synthase MnmA [Mogibacterium sp.]
MARVVVGLSGGVDSAVAAYLLKKEGHNVIGATLRTWEAGSGAYSRCCDITDARRTAMQLEIPYYNINSLPEFSEHVTEPFMRAYVNGLTPNPCVACNRYVKWERMLKFADEVNAEFIATGHYARVVRTENGRYTVKQASEAAKDQTYMLYMLTQEQLARTLMPLADLSKDEVRRIAGEAGLDVAGKRDSQEICFVLDGGYAEYISSHYDGKLPPPGDFLDTEGRVLGKHRGIINYTVGQRKGLGIALGYPAYVKEIDAERDAVILGDEASVTKDEITVRDLSFMSREDIRYGESIEAFVKIRYHHPAVPAVIERTGEDAVSVSFTGPVKAPAPGQAAVFYDSLMRVMGGGTISK